uniref:Mono-ADP ribosylhydrolase 2 n=1 Tax=Neolamprologus brichardi TaxID=32507 RepID=A0A3Q4H2E5_NEOBR
TALIDWKRKVWRMKGSRLLHLSLDDRRKEYRRQDFISLDKILTWREKNRLCGRTHCGNFYRSIRNQECCLSEKLGQHKYN